MTGELLQQIGGGLAFVGVIVLLLFLRIRRQRIDEAKASGRVQKAIADITEDGVVEGPKGKYRPRRLLRKWAHPASDSPEPATVKKVKWFKS